MKKALSFAVALGLVAGMASSAVAADLVLKGDARLRGYYKNNSTDATDAAPDRKQSLDQRYRLNADVVVNDAVKINTRILLTDTVEFGNENGLKHSVDRANMVIKALGGTVTLGKQNASWGNKFLGWGSTVDRIKYVAKAADLTYGGYLQKSNEGAQADGDGDKDTWGGLVIAKAGASKFGVLANYVYADTKTNQGASETGYLLDLFFNTKAGPANIMTEIVFKGGDAMDNAAQDDYFGGFVGASMNLNDQLAIKGLIAFYDGNMGDSSPARDCDNDFAPSLLIGTCNETAVIDFGGTTGLTSDMTYLIAGGGDLKVSDKLSFGAGLGYLMASEEVVGSGGVGLMGRDIADPATIGSDEATLIEIDLSMKYALAQNTTYSLGIALGMVDNFSAADDDIFVIGNRVDVKF